MQTRIEPKKATKEDLQTLNKLLRASKGYWGYNEEFLDKFMGIFAVSEKNVITHETWKFFDDQKLVGVITLDINEPELINLFVDPQYIGKGFGAEIWHFSVERFAAEKINSFKIWADPNANGFYEKMGAKFLYSKVSPMGKDRITSVYEYRTLQVFVKRAK
jgi:GNAT superfamily N-acetyltransferase